MNGGCLYKGLIQLSGNGHSSVSSSGSFLIASRFTPPGSRAFFLFDSGSSGLGYDCQKSECLIFCQSHFQISLLTLEGVVKKSMHLSIGLPPLLFPQDVVILSLEGMATKMTSMECQVRIGIIEVLLRSNESTQYTIQIGGAKVLTTPEKVKHPYIVIQEGYCGGSPIIAGTKFPVRSVVTYVLKQGMTPEELLKEFSHLTLAQVYDALSYYYDHKTEIEHELSENTEEKLGSQAPR